MFKLLTMVCCISVFQSAFADCQTIYQERLGIVAGQKTQEKNKLTSKFAIVGGLVLMAASGYRIASDYDLSEEDFIAPSMFVVGSMFTVGGASELLSNRDLKVYELIQSSIDQLERNPSGNDRFERLYKKIDTVKVNLSRDEVAQMIVTASNEDQLCKGKTPSLRKIRRSIGPEGLSL